MMPEILIADDDTGVLSALSLLLKSEGFSPILAASPEQAITTLRQKNIRLLLMDLNFSRDTTSGEEGLALIDAIRQFDDLLPIVVMTGWGTIELAINSIKKGANDFLQKPWENERLLAIVKNQLKFAEVQNHSQKLVQQNRILAEQVRSELSIIAHAPASKAVVETLHRVAESEANVLFTGENGTGKSMFARYLHDISARKNTSLVSVNMGAVTETLFESEMFGHVKGAYTDAKSARIGRFELADGGTLFLDEIANTPLSQQGKLLRVLEDQQFERVGASVTTTVDVRLISATNADLAEAVKAGGFRQDLLYRINTIEITIPPLRERVEDIVPLANAFLEKVAKKYAQPAIPISVRAQQALKTYNWPGNVRELGHVIERAHILCQSHIIDVSDLGLNCVRSNISAEPSEEDLRTFDNIEKDIIHKRLAYFDGDAVQAAASLGWSRSAFYRRLSKVKNGD